MNTVIIYIIIVIINVAVAVTIVITIILRSILLSLLLSLLYYHTIILPYYHNFNHYHSYHDDVLLNINCCSIL